MYSVSSRKSYAGHIPLPLCGIVKQVSGVQQLDRTQVFSLIHAGDVNNCIRITVSYSTNSLVIGGNFFKLTGVCLTL